MIWPCDTTKRWSSRSIAIQSRTEVSLGIQILQTKCWSVPMLTSPLPKTPPVNCDELFGGGSYSHDLDLSPSLKCRLPFSKGLPLGVLFQALHTKAEGERQHISGIRPTRLWPPCTLICLSPSQLASVPKNQNPPFQWKPSEQSWHQPAGPTSWCIYWFANMNHLV